MAGSLDEKVKSIFGMVAINKAVANNVAISRVPRFISEYLINFKCGESQDAECVSRLSRYISELYPDPSDRELFLSRLKERGSLKLLDEFKVRVDLKRNTYLLEIPSLQIADAFVNEDIVRENARLFSGLWGVGLLYYKPELSRSKNRTPVVLHDYRPFQASYVDLKLFVESRSKFTFEEWVDLLVTSIGLNPKAYTLGQRLLLLSRLIPVAEPNVNILELGPRATGKTSLYRNVAYYSRIYAGGTITPARLFFDARLSVPGDLALHDVIVFDEISRVRLSNPDELVAKLKDYMVDGFFERGALKRAHSTCSLVFLGNVDVERIADPSHILEYLPSFMRDSAFLDRIHGFIPGWRLPKIMRSEESLASGYGLASDYLAEVLHRLRDVAAESVVADHVEFVGKYTIRDEKAVKRLLSGAVKILFPNFEFDNAELARVARGIVGLRNNVSRLLTAISPSEFPPKKLEVKVRG
ncbi:BREX system Lon protease-like protein BrxL [Thermofilum pendens]|uniref:ATP-dependent protease La n=1 Tax=Thermofilum pendens (strain DSM 2475 / Hrk 5) TaxID=368408 RepID=A1S165_THEPD|nr:BREX system Lon protease-like protein BrxL [Thermofilum pendens]ABL79195.1 ATP-dependent protease La [Thermofilum pendens Hrk 5]